MHLLPLSFLAGILTVLAPCVFPLLPVIIGGSLTNKSIWRPLIVTLSLAVSIILFTLLLQGATALINIPQSFWKWISGTIVLFFGITYIFPKLWIKIEHVFNLGQGSKKSLAQANQKKSFMGAVLVGMSLGPVFASCSPTYLLIVSTVLPQGFVVGLINLIVYALGLALVMFLVALLGQKFIHKMRWATDVNGLFRKILGVLFIVVGLAVLTGLDKKIEAQMLTNTDSYIFKLLEFEQGFLKDAKKSFQ